MKKHMLSISLFITFLSSLPAADNPKAASAPSTSFCLGASLDEILEMQESEETTKNVFGCYPEENPYIAASSIIPGKLAAHGNRYAVTRIRKLPGALLLGLFASSDIKTLKTAPEELFSSNDITNLIKEYQECLSKKAWLQLVNNMQQHAQKFNNHKIQKENEALTRTDEACDQAFQEQWNRVPVSACIILFIAKCKPTKQPMFRASLFEWSTEENQAYHIELLQKSPEPDFIKPLTGAKLRKTIDTQDRFIVTQGYNLSDQQKGVIRRTENLGKAIECAGACLANSDALHSQYDANGITIAIDHEKLNESLIKELPTHYRNELNGNKG